MPGQDQNKLTGNAWLEVLLWPVVYSASARRPHPGKHGYVALRLGSILITPGRPGC